MMAEGRRQSGLYREFEAPTPKRKRVSFCRLISYRETLDLLLMIVGTIGAIGAGTSQPLLALLFGDAIDAFNPKDLSEMTRSNMLHEVSVGRGAASVLGNNLGADLIFNNAVVGWSITAERQAGRIRSLYLKSLLRQDVSYFDEEFAVGEAMNKISGALLIQDALGDKVANVIELTTRFVAGFVIGLYSNWKMTAVTLAALPPTLLVGGAIALGLTKATNQATIAYSEAGEIVNEVLGSIRTLCGPNICYCTMTYI